MEDFKVQLEQNLPKIRAYAQRLCGDTQLPDDLMQDVAIAFLEKPRQPPTTEYLMSIACNVNRYQRRKAKVRQTVALGEHIEDKRYDPRLDVERREQMKCVQLALSKLNEKELKLVFALWWDEKPYKVAAKELGLKLNGIKSRRLRLKVKIASAIRSVASP